MGIPIAAIGVKIGYKAAAANSKPATVSWGTGGFTQIQDIKSTPDFNPQPNTADATTFDNLEYTTYVDLLKDLGGALEFTANLTADFEDAWGDAVTASATNNGLWWAIDVPGISKSIVFFGTPSALGLPALTANSLMETTVYVTPTGEPSWVADAT